ncbi:MAG: GxxExxY protein [Kiritimatiellae bacterium]|nr:GxxExxY protein [Kiritimatiellia bacterium]
MAEILERELVYRIVGCAMKVHSEIGYGLREKTYERGLCLEFKHEGIAFDQQSAYPVFYRGQKIDEYVPDLEVEKRVIVDVKTIERITDVERGQMMNYLRVSGLKVGLILNFRNASLEWERIVLDTAR